MTRRKQNAQLIETEVAEMATPVETPAVVETPLPVETPAAVESASRALTSAALAAWEDGSKDGFIAALLARLASDGSNLPEAFAASKAPPILLRVGALTSKTRTGAAVLDASKVTEPFEIIPVDADPNGVMHVILNFRNKAEDMLKLALAAVVTAIAYHIARSEESDPIKREKTKRWTNKTFNAISTSIGLTRTLIKNNDGKVTGNFWTATGAAEDILRDAEANLGAFPAAALAFFGKAPKPSKVALVHLNVNGKTFVLLHSAGPTETAALVGTFRAAGLVVARVEYADPETLAAAFILMPGTVYRKNAKVPYEPISLDAPDDET